jgi:hypothetical protein
MGIEIRSSLCAFEIFDQNAAEGRKNSTISIVVKEG